jgi:hypothetical protein
LAEATFFQIDVDRSQRRALMDEGDANRVGIMLLGPRVILQFLIVDPNGLALARHHFG